MAVWQNDAEHSRSLDGTVSAVPVEEAAGVGHPAPNWGQGEEPNPKPKQEEVKGEDYPINVSP